jgi:hypothetical protein
MTNLLWRGKDEARFIRVRKALTGRPGLTCDGQRAGAWMTLVWGIRKVFDGWRHFAKVRAYAVNGLLGEMPTRD